MGTSYASAVINASADEVWAIVRDFGELAEWAPSIESCEIEGGGDGTLVGAVRRLSTAGGVFRERLVALSDADRSLSYEFVESPLPVRKVLATMRVAPVTATGGAFVEWSSEFDADAKDEEMVTKIFTKAVYAAGLDALGKHFS
jgi:polyketide cyclase/dehydrase/lipid transport protein